MIWQIAVYVIPGERINPAKIANIATQNAAQANDQRAWKRNDKSMSNATNNYDFLRYH